MEGELSLVHSAVVDIQKINEYILEQLTKIVNDRSGSQKTSQSDKNDLSKCWKALRKLERDTQYNIYNLQQDIRSVQRENKRLRNLYNQSLRRTQWSESDSQNSECDLYEEERVNALNDNVQHMKSLSDRNTDNIKGRQSQNQSDLKRPEQVRTNEETSLQSETLPTKTDATPSPRKLLSNSVLNAYKQNDEQPLAGGISKFKPNVPISNVAHTRTASTESELAEQPPTQLPIGIKEDDGDSQPTPKTSEETRLKSNDVPVDIADTEEVVPKQFYGSSEVWVVEADAELLIGKSSLPVKEGVFTIFLVDTSSSMKKDNAWHETKTFFNDFMSGLETMSRVHGCVEYVAMVTFGNQTRCQQGFTSDLSLVKDAFERITLGGPSPLYGGMLMTQAVAIQPDDTKVLLAENDVFLRTRVILITDGHATETNLHQGPDIVNPDSVDEIASSVINISSYLGSELRVDVFFVPVGNDNSDLLRLVCEMSMGRILAFREGQQAARRQYLARHILPANRFQFLFAHSQNRVPTNDPSLTIQDKTQMREILEISDQEHEIRRRLEEPFNEETDDRLLPVGTRVQKGPDWNHGDQGKDGVGTVIGHRKPFLGLGVWVAWDKDTAFNYDYGHHGRYAVFPVDKPRVLGLGFILDIGCIVTPGVDFSGDRAKQGDKGVVLDIRRSRPIGRAAMVRWDNGLRGYYRFDGEKREIRLCTPDEAKAYRPTHLPPADCAHGHPGAPPSLPVPVTTRPKKNKNKNA